MIEGVRTRPARSERPDDRLVDAVVASGILVVGLLEAALRPSSPHTPGLFALVLAYSVPLAWRRRWPLAVLVVTTTCGPALTHVTAAGGLISYVLAEMLAAYTVGRLCDRPRAWWGPAIILGEGWVYSVLFHGVLSDYVFIALLYGGPWVVGVALHRRERHIVHLTDEAESLRTAQAERARAAVEAERARIARELHDIVSHSISVITIQAQALRLRLPRERAGDAADLQAIESTARQAMTEMRRLLGVLRDDSSNDHQDLAPQPGLADLPALLDAHRSAGRPTRYSVEGEAVPLPPGVDLTAYRVIQEALTNVRKHAEPGRTEVTVAYHPEGITVTVDDDRPARGDRTDPPGHGLVGMRERVTLYGGELRAGPNAAGGWTVQAKLPVQMPR